MKDIAVIGAGPAGAAFALYYKMESENKVYIYERDPYYRKPCGEVIIASLLNESEIIPPILNEIKNFDVRVKRETVFQKEFSRPIWYVIDKAKWIINMRNKAEKEGAKIIYSNAFPKELTKKHDIIIDARGPFSPNSLPKITITRAIVESNEHNDDSVILDFDPEKMGMLWIFPSGKNKLNIGLAYASIRNPLDLLKKTLEELNLSKKIFRIDTTIITVSKPDFTINEKTYRIGEAAGLVHPLSGEGIRPSFLHGKCLGIELAKEKSATNSYRKCQKKLSSIISQIKLQYLLYNVMNTLPENKRTTIMRRLDKRFYENFMQDNITWMDLTRALLRNPLILPYLLKSLL